MLTMLMRRKDESKVVYCSFAMTGSDSSRKEEEDRCYTGAKAKRRRGGRMQY